MKSVTKLDLHIAKCLRSARLQRGISQSEAGEVLCVSFQQVQKCEQGTNRTTASKLFELAGSYDVPIRWFFEDFESDKKAVKAFKRRLKGAAKV